MSKIDKLKEKYITDTEAMASKSRFGYFSLLPSHTAAHTDFDHPQRTHLNIQTKRIATEEYSPNPGTSTAATPTPPPFRKISSLTPPQHFKARPIKTLANSSERRNFNRANSSRENKNSDQPN